MKATIISMLVLVLAASSFGASVLVGNFENSMDGFWQAGWNAGDSATPAQMYPTVGEWSLKGVIANGGWVENAEGGFQGTLAQVAIGSVGKITFDATSFYNTYTGVLRKDKDGNVITNYHQVCVLVNCNGWWNVYGYVSLADSGVTQSYEIQLPADAMAAFAAATGYANIGLLTNSTGSQSILYDDEGTELEPAFDGLITTYFDNINFVIPEPATMALLGLGGLSLIRRKR